MTENDKAIEFLTRMGDLLYGRDWIVPLGREMEISHRPLCQPGRNANLMSLTECSVGFRAALGTGLAVQFVPPRPVGGVF